VVDSARANAAGWPGAANPEGVFMSVRRVLSIAACLIGFRAPVANAQTDLQIGPLSYRQYVQLPESKDCDEFYSVSPNATKATKRLSDTDLKAKAATLQPCIVKLAGDVKKAAGQSANQPAPGLSPAAQQLLDQTTADLVALEPALRDKSDNRITQRLRRRVEDDIRALTDEIRGQHDAVVRLLRESFLAAIDEASETSKPAVFDALKSQLAALGGNKPKVTESKIHDALLSQYLAFRNVRNWFLAVSRPFKRDTTPHDEYAHLVTAFNGLETTLKGELEGHDLTPSFAAELITGANIFQAVGAFQSNPTPGTLQAAKAGASVAPLAYLVWESRHYGSERGSKTEFSVGGKFGEIPALVLLVPKPPLPATSPCSALTKAPGPCLSDMSAAYETALMASLSGRVHFRPWETGELAVRMTAGESYLTADSFIVGQGVGSTAALPVANGTGQAEPFWETAVDASIYGKKLDLVHAAKDFLAPLFYMEFGFRNDRRFDRFGDLEHFLDPSKSLTEPVGFRDPARRYFYRFALGNIAVAGKDDSGPHNFVLSFGVEGDGPLHDRPHIPASVRLFIRGDVNLLKSFTPSSGK
jgi:hypothetical protein